MAIVPKSVPQQKMEKTREILGDHGVDLKKPAILAVRGYYRDTMGKPGKNDFGLFDDAFLVLTPSAYWTVNGNVDPVRARPGNGFGASKGMGHLKLGLWAYEKGIHRGYQAFVQAMPFTVLRDADRHVPEEKRILIDGSWYYENTGWFGVNHHRGGVNNVSSIACQTVYEPQWKGHKEHLYSEMDRYGQKKIPYLLIEA